METTKKKILIIEDEKPMARALELKLTHAGFEAVGVGNGEEGLAALEKGTLQRFARQTFAREFCGA